MTQDEIQELLGQLSALLEQQGMIGEIALYGGAAMVLAHHARISTKDVDAIFIPKQAVYDAAARVAEENGLEKDWLNDAVKGFLSEKNEVLPFLDYPGLKVFVASPQYLLAMKCMSMRLGRDDTDLSDVRFLMDRLGLSEATQVLDLVARYYPAEQIPPKTRFAIEEICQNLPSP
jgi:hypothetical protein